MLNSMKHHKELERLRKEYDLLDIEISKRIKSKVVNSFEIQMLKKSRLEKKEEIERLQSLLLGDIVA